MAEAIPNGIIMSDVVIKHHTPQFFTESLNMKQRARPRNLHQLQGSITLTAYGANRRAMEAWLLRVRGRLNTVLINLGGRMTSETVENVPLTIADITTGATNVSLKNMAGYVSPGDAFTFPNDSKVHFAMNQVVNNGDMEFYPPSRLTTIPANTAVSFEDVTIEVFLDSDTQEIYYDESGLIHSMTIEWKEAV